MKKSKLFASREKLAGILFALPMLLYAGVFLIAPVVLSLFFSFTKWNMRSTPVWVGVDNYVNLLTDSVKYPYFWHSLKVTLTYSLLAVPMTIISGLVLALIINSIRKEKLEGFFKVAFYLPVITSSVAVAAIWKWVYDPMYGLLNTFLEAIGLKGFNWLGDSKIALFAVAILAAWGCGGTMLIYLAGLKGIPDQLYESAKIDGASSFRQFFGITLPMLKPTTFFLVVTTTIGSFQVFDIVYVLYGAGGGSYGGPDNSLLTFTMYIYNHAFRYEQMGVACAMSFILFVIILILTIVQFKFLPQRYD